VYYPDRDTPPTARQLDGIKSMSTLEERDRLIDSAQDHWARREISDALDAYEAAMALFQEDELGSEYYAMFCNNFAAVAEADTQFTRAELLFLTARPIFEAAGRTSDVAMVDLNLGFVFRGMEKLDRSTAKLEAARRDYEALGDTSGVALCLVSLALNAVATGRLRRAREALDRGDALGLDLAASPRAALVVPVPAREARRAGGQPGHGARRHRRRPRSRARGRRPALHRRHGAAARADCGGPQRRRAGAAHVRRGRPIQAAGAAGRASGAAAPGQGSRLAG
jgi:tetratricopeptide (TPR) repeat protein